VPHIKNRYILSMIKRNMLHTGVLRRFTVPFIITSFLLLATTTLVIASSEHISVLRNNEFNNTSYWTNAKFFTVENNTLLFDASDRNGKRWLQQNLIDTLVDQRNYTITTDIELSADAEVWLRVVHNHGTNFYRQNLAAGRHQIEARQYISWRQEHLEKARVQVLVYDNENEVNVPYTLHAIDLTYQAPIDLLSGLRNIVSVTDDTVVVDGYLQVESLSIGGHDFVVDQDGNLCIGNCPQATATSTDEVIEEETEEETETDETETSTEETSSSTDPVDDQATTTEEVATTTDVIDDETATTTNETATSTEVAEEETATSTEAVEDLSSEASAEEEETATSTEETTTEPVATSTATSTN